MDRQSAEEHRDFLCKAYGFSGFFFFGLASFISMILAIFLKNYSTLLAVISVASLFISITFSICISIGDSNQYYRRVYGDEPTFEEIELEERRRVSRIEDPRRLSTDYVRSIFNLPPARTDSESSSKSEDDPDVQETVTMMKEKEAKQKLAATAGGYLGTSSEEESRVIQTVADVHIADEKTKSSDQMPTHSKERRKIFHLTQLPFIYLEDSSSGIVESAEGIQSQESLPSDSN